MQCNQIQTPAALLPIHHSVQYIYSAHGLTPFPRRSARSLMIAAPGHSVSPASAHVTLNLRYLLLVQLNTCGWTTRKSKLGVSPMGSYGSLRKGKDPRANKCEGVYM